MFVIECQVGTRVEICGPTSGGSNDYVKKSGMIMERRASNGALGIKLDGDDGYSYFPDASTKVLPSKLFAHFLLIVFELTSAI